VVCDEDRINYVVDFYSKSTRLSISIFTVIVIDIVAEPYWRQTVFAIDAICPVRTCSAGGWWSIFVKVDVRVSLQSNFAGGAMTHTLRMRI
jgi:hypothetical protein